MTRWKAFTLHFAISAAIAGAVLAVFVFVWYPPPLFGATGSVRLLCTILLVLAVLGPLLTLILFKPGKKGLKFDLVIIALLQTATLAYGLHVAFQARPAWIVVMPHRATLVHANELDLESAPARYARAPLWGAEPVGIIQLDHTTRQALIDDLFAGKPDVDYRPHFYAPLTERLPDITNEAEPLQRRLDASSAAKERYIAWLRRHGKDSAQRLHVLPLITTADELELVVDANDASIVGYLRPGELD